MELWGSTAPSEMSPKWQTLLYVIDAIDTVKILCFVRNLTGYAGFFGFSNTVGGKTRTTVFIDISASSEKIMFRRHVDRRLKRLNFCTAFYDFSNETYNSFEKSHLPFLI